MEQLAAKVPEILRLDASAEYVQQTVNGSRTGYVIVFRQDSKAAPKSDSVLHANAIGTGIVGSKGRISSSASKRQVFETANIPGVPTFDRFDQLPVGFVELSTAEELNRLLSHPDIESIHEDRVNRPSLADSLPMINQPAIIGYGNLGQGTSVAVLDTGVDYVRSAFGNCTSPGQPAATCRVIYVQDFAPDDGQLDDHGHGTNVAAIVAGVATGAKIIGLDVFRQGGALDSEILAAMNWVVANKATYNIAAMNLSLGVPGEKYTAPITTGPYKAAVDAARAVNIVTVIAAGNDGFLDGVSTPAATQGAISVGAVFSTAFPTETCNGGVPGKPACFSNSASFLTLLAPGQYVTAAGIRLRGSSHSAPHVSGAYAVLRAAFPGETIDVLTSRLTSSGIQTLDARNNLTIPRIDLWRAMGSCTYTFGSTTFSVSNAGGTGAITLTTNSPVCPWTLSTASSWFRITSATQGVGNATITYAADINPGLSTRSAAITARISNPVQQTLTATQSGASADQGLSTSAVGMSFGNSAKGVSSAPLNATITNTGNISTLTIGTIDIVGPSGISVDFLQSNNCIGDRAPQAVCTISVTFLPADVGLRTATLRVFSNAPGSPQLISMSGTGIGGRGGEIDITFGTAGVVNPAPAPSTGVAAEDLFVLPDNSIVVGGTFRDYGVSGLGKFRITKYLSGGSRDALFGIAGTAIVDPAPGRNNQLQLVRPDSQGRIVAFGTSYAPNGAQEAKVVIIRLLPNGQLDASFGTGGIAFGSFGAESAASQLDTLEYAIVLSDDRLAIKLDCKIVRLSSTGVRDLTYGPNGFADTNICGQSVMRPLSDGSFIYTMSLGFNNSQLVWGVGVAKINANGLTDYSFGNNGRAVAGLVAGADYAQTNDLAVSVDGTILAVGSIWRNYIGERTNFSSYAVRFSATGAIDTSFGSGGITQLSDEQTGFDPVALRSFPDERVAILSGSWTFSAQFEILVLKKNGIPDDSFGVGGRVLSPLGFRGMIAIAQDNKIIATFYGLGDFALARFTGPRAFSNDLLGLGSRVVGSLGLSVPVVFTNTSSQTVTYVSASTPNGDFSVSGDDCGSSIAPGATCRIFVEFNPAVVGVRNSNLTVTTSAGNFIVGITGTGTVSPSLQLVAAYSRKIHGASDKYDLTIDRIQTIGGAVTIEPRMMGPAHQVVFLFNGPISQPGTATVTDQNNQSPGTVAGVGIGVNSNEVVVTLTGIPDKKRATFTLSNVNGNTPAQVSLGFMIGDVSGNKVVNASDIAAIKARLSLPIDATTFRYDLNLSNTVTAADVSVVKARSGTVLP